jgi:TolB protein
MNDDLLRDSLTRISERVMPVDLLDRSLARSRRIGRNRALVAATATVATIALAVGAVWQLGVPSHGTVPPAQSASPSTSAPASPSPSGSVSVSPSVVPTPSGGSVVGLSGWLYYYSFPDLYRLTPAGLEFVVRAPHAAVSPDGLQIAYVDDAGELIVTDRDGGQPRSVLSGVVGLGHEPAWSPDSRRLLVARPPAGGDGSVTYGVVDVASGEFTPLAEQIQGIHPLWSADGQHLGYTTGTCQLMVADADGRNARMVPVIGDPDPAVNPQQRFGCGVYSVSPDGSLMAVNQAVGDEPWGDIGRSLAADVVIDTRTGDEVPLPVSGQVWAALFLPNGEVLVRSTDGDTFTLTLLNPDLSIKTQVSEPPAASANPCGQSSYGCALLAYTPN